MHYDAALDVLRYMRNTSHTGLKYWPVWPKHMCNNALPLTGWVDEVGSMRVKGPVLERNVRRSKVHNIMDMCFICLVV